MEYRIVTKQILNPTVIRIAVEAPLVARKAQAGQFVILRVGEHGERIPLTVAGTDSKTGTVEVIYQVVGATTAALSQLEVGDHIADFVGPLGCPTELEGVENALVVGGGVGCAIALPVARALKAKGAHVDSVIGFRTKDLVILEKEFEEVSESVTLMTDDGSKGRHGNVTLPIGELLGSGKHYDRIFAIGPLVMMKFVTLSAKPFGVPVTVSMNPIMVDGTGMCGGCRLSLLVDGKRVTKFACVDGPDFDGYQVDFDEAMERSSAFATEEAHARAQCNLFKA
ncbi:MAG: sulfide/dihydroorotate dehydrogenase-like FAD/NAD-binding protein [Clostridia bacterium]|nr:sulfide/dihydroorotate dehydrogenase-like FAD/NAD-binding protein [Clostridia bacterium]